MLAAGLSIAGNLLIQVVTQFVLGWPVEIAQPGMPTEPLPVPAVALFSALPALVAAGLYWILGRVTSRQDLWMWVIGGVVLVLSMAPVLQLPTAALGKLALALMHVWSAAAILWALTRAR